MAARAMVVWTELVDVDGADPAEPDAPAVVADREGTMWVRPMLPGRPDLWYRVGAGRGVSAVEWKTLVEQRPVFVAWKHDPPEFDEPAP